MDSNIYNASDGLRDTIPTFDFSNFASKDTIFSKAQYVLANVLFGKIISDMEVDFDMITR
jgi:hypothetical protein